MPGRGRPVLVGALLGLILLVAVFGYVAYRLTLESQPAAAESVLVIALTEDVDGAQVAGMLGVVDWAPGGKRVRVVDPLLEVDGADTSFTALKDQYPFGGGEAVSEALAALEGREPLPWVVLPADVWIEIIDTDGGVPYDVRRPTNAYVRGDLFLIEGGEQSLSGGATYALAAGAYATEDTTTVPVDMVPLSEAVLETLDASWIAIVNAVDAGRASSSLRASTLQEMAE